MNGRALIVIAAGILAVAGLWLLMKPQPPAAPPADAPPVPVTWTIEGGHRVTGTSPIRVAQHSVIALTVISDTDDELHVHGYDIGADLKAGVPTTLTITADRSGRFDIELHHAHGEVGALEVMPR